MSYYSVQCGYLFPAASVLQAVLKPPKNPNCASSHSFGVLSYAQYKGHYEGETKMGKKQ